MTTEKYPFDFDALQKGDLIDAIHIEKVLRLSRGTPAYQLKLMGLKDEVERELMQRGRPVTVKIEKQSLRILTDAEATEYNEARFNHQLRGAKRSFHRQMNVDVSQLTEDQKASHERRVLWQGGIMTAIVNEKKRLMAEPHVSPSRKALASAE
jgi:predicted small secreted protein